MKADQEASVLALTEVTKVIAKLKNISSTDTPAGRTTAATNSKAEQPSRTSEALARAKANREAEAKKNSTATA